ncbi:hypothetical protein AB0H07_39030 [Streptomyces sp. NPDC021354]|uniref:hypothetical protein n=1 Tax=Streptomyces sp. NPDC021354 TaxID=3154793 RepID=UPI0033D0CA1C
MNTAQRNAVVAMLKANKPPQDIQNELQVSVGEIAAVAETERLTAAHTKTTSPPAPETDSEMARAFAALAWAEESHTARIRNLASRTRAGLNEVLQFHRDAEKIAKAEGSVAELEQKLAQARARLRRLKGGKPKTATPRVQPTQEGPSKQERDQIRTRAREHGMPVSQVGSISKEVRDAWNQRPTATDAAARPTGGTSE